MKPNDDKKKSGNVTPGNGKSSVEKSFSLLKIYPTENSSQVIPAGDGSMQASFPSPEYSPEGEEGGHESTQNDQSLISSGEDDGSSGSASPNSNPNGGGNDTPVEGGGGDGSIKLGTGNYAKGKQTKAEKKAAELQTKGSEIDGKSKQDVEKQDSEIEDGKKKVEEKAKDKEGQNQKGKEGNKEKQNAKKEKLQAEAGKVGGKDGQENKAPATPKTAPQNKTTPPAKSPKGKNGGSKKKGQNYVVDSKNASLFGGSQIVKTTQAGNAVAYAEGGLNQEQEGVAQPLPQHIIQAELDKRKQANSTSIEAFRGQSQNQIAQVKTNASNQQTQINVTQTIILGNVEIATTQALDKVETDLQAAKEEISTQFDGFKTDITAHSQTVIESIQAKKVEEQAKIDTELASAKEAALQMQETTISAAETSIETQVQRIRDEALRMGELAVERANAQADIERAKAVPEQSGWQDFKNGGDYEENKKKARVEACVEVGKQTKKQFLETAENAAAELLSSKAAIREEITANVTQLTDGFTSQAEDTKTALGAQADGHVEQVTSETAAMIAELDSKKASEIAALESFGASKKSEIRQVSAQLKSQLQEQVNSAKQQLEQTSSSSLQQLQSSQSELISQLQSAAEMPVEDFGTLQSNLTQQFQTAASGMANSINQMGKQTTEGLNSAGTQFVEQLNQLGTTSSEAINSQKDQAISTGEGIKASSIASLDNTKTQSEAELSAITENLKSFFTAKISEFTNMFSEASQQIDQDLVGKADEVIAGFQAELDKLPATLIDKAAEAEAAVKPRWRKIVGVLIEIVAAVALAAVVALLVASGVGIIGLLIGGAIAGALIGAGKQMLNNAIDGKPLTEGVGKAMAVGAVEGVFAALTGGAGSQIMSKVGGKLTSMGAGTFVSGASKFGQRAVGKFAVQALTNISEGVSKTIVGNLADGKAWNTGVLQAVASGTIDSIIGFGTGAATSKIQGSSNLGSQVGESFSRRAGREVVELGTDFAGNSLSSGAQNVVKNWDNITSGEAGLLDSFGEGVTNDWETNLVKSGTRNANSTVTNHIRDNAATRRLESDGVDAPDLADGYRYTVNNSGDVDVRKTHNRDANNEALPDLKYNSETNTVADPTAKPTLTQEAEEAETTTTGSQSTTAKGDETEATSSGTQSASAKEAESRGLPQAPDGYHYSTSSKGTLYLRRTSRTDANGVELPQLRIDGDQIVRDGLTAEHTQTYSSPDELAATYDPKGRLSRADRGMIYNYYQQGKFDEIENILQLNTSKHSTATLWPPSRGGYNVQNEQAIQPDSKFDRYGGVMYDDDGNLKMQNGLPTLTGSFTSPMNENGTPQPFDSRALDKERNEYDVYYEIEVIGDIDITSNNASVMPWFDKEGNGTQSEWNIPINPDTITPTNPRGYPYTWNELQDMGLIRIKLKESPSGNADVNALINP